MTFHTQLTQNYGPLPKRLRLAQAAHIEEAAACAEQALKPDQESLRRIDSTDWIAAFHRHAQAASTLREVAMLLDQS
jgi:hypothetical protein